MFRVGSLIKSSNRYRKSQDALSALRVRQVAKELIEQELLKNYPQEILKNLRTTTIRGGVLTVVCPPTLSAEIYTKSEELIKAINKKLGVRMVVKLRFKAG